MEDSQFCSICVLETAQIHCGCQFPPIPLCRTCIAQHEESTEGTHMPFPSHILLSEEALQEAREHYIRICAAEDWLKRSLEEVQKCDKAIREAYAKAAERLKVFAEERIQTLGNLATALAGLIAVAHEEISPYLIENREFSGSDLGNLLWNFSNSVHPSSMDIFHWKVAISEREIDAIEVSFWTPFEEISQYNVKRGFNADIPYPESQIIGSFLDYQGPNSSAVPSTTVVYVTSTNLRFFDCSTEQWQAKVPLSSPIQADETSSYAILETGEVLLTGGGIGGAAWNSVYLLGGYGEVRELNRLRKPRRRHALIIHLGFAYIFGGWSQTREKSSEKLRAESVSCLERCYWRAMADMLSERSSFNPCAHGALIYLCGGSGTEASEVFDPVEELYAALPFQLPESTETFSILIEDSLHIVSKEFICRWQVNKLLSYYANDRVQIWGSMTPVAMRDTVYLPFIIDVRGDVKKLDISNYEWTQIPSPD